VTPAAQKLKEACELVAALLPVANTDPIPANSTHIKQAYVEAKRLAEKAAEEWLQSNP
jgi:hypothetical protein